MKILASLSLGLMVGLVTAGCGEPPRMVAMGPPGSQPDIVPPEIKEKQAAALGETSLTAAKQSAAATRELELLEATEEGTERELESGLKYTTLKPPADDGKVAKPGSQVQVHYTGTLEDGSQFDSSRGKQPLSFVLGSGDVIEGWDIGVTGMKTGEIRKLVIPAELAYGSQSKPGIPANSTLHFEVELLDVQE